MTGHGQINVISKCRNFLKYMNLGINTNYRIGRWEIPNFITCTIASIPLLLSIVLDYWTACDVGLDNFQENGNVFFVSLGCTQLQFNYICLAYNNVLIVQTIEHMQKIINQRNESSSKASNVYRVVEVENTTRAEKMGKYIFIFVFLSCLPSAISPIRYMLFDFPIPEKWQLPLVMNMRIRTDTYVGFYIAYALQYFICYFYSYWVAVILLFYISLFYFADGITIDLKGIGSELNLLDKKSLEIDTQKSKLLLKDWIDLHNDLLKLLNNIRILMSGPLFSQLSCCIIETVMELLTIDYAIQQKHLGTSFFANIGTMSIHMFMVFILCFYADKFTTQSFRLNQTVYSDLLWYNLRVNEQKLVILPICRAQKPFHLVGYGIFDANMEIFLKIIQSSISYFIIMRQLRA